MFKIKKNIKLAPFTTFNIGGKADYFVEAKSTEQIIKAIKWAREKNIPYTILGGGSNILISDKGVKGLVVAINNQQLTINNDCITVDAGVSLSKLVLLATDHNLSGLESLVGIPGTVGGAIYGNAGVKSKSIGDCLQSITVLDKTGKIKKLDVTECNFKYRDSRFNKTDEIILKAVFSLKKTSRVDIAKKIKKFSALRDSQPKGKSVGSIFKNPKDNPAGLYLDRCKFKGKIIGGAKISKDHANWIINFNHAKAIDVLKLINIMKKAVKKRFNINLEEEIKYIGEFDKNPKS